MKHKILIIFLTISLSGFSQNNIFGIYSIENLTEKVDFNIYLFKNGNYYIEFSENVTDDIISSLVLSYGDYTIINNMITLTDKTLNFKMQFIIENNTLTVIQGFVFMERQKKIFISNDPGNEMEINYCNININLIQKEREQYNNSHTVLVPLDFGIFENEQGYKLYIYPNNKYVLEFKNIKLSEGEWKRDNNLLNLLDLSLYFTFYVLIKDNILISKLLPGDIQGMSLFKK